MTDTLFSTSVQCPYCWEAIDVMVEDCGETQQYIEDCQVCCRPINVVVRRDHNDEVQVEVYGEDE